MDPKKLQIKDFTYELPENKIAKYPLPKRDESKLLIYKDGTIEENIYANTDAYIPANSLLIFNNTKVVEARLIFQKSTGSIIELFCLEPADVYADITTAMLQKEKVLWKCLVGAAKKWKEDLLVKKIERDQKELLLTAKKIEKLDDHFIIELSWDDELLSFAEVLHYAGAIPLPPYLNRSAEEADKERYQTIYATFEGSVAAPTAGLHFTENIFQKLKAKDIDHDFVTLHVGAGTFKPVKAEKIENHEMHSEFIEVKREVIEHLLNKSTDNIIAVGTTSLRTIESLYWFGIKILLQPEIDLYDLQLQQWEAYELSKHEISVQQSLQTLSGWMKRNKIEKLITKTQIIIAPGYKLKIAKALITNFHQPQSTLLLLIAAIIGNEWKRVYDYALKNDFRFLSYGDGCLLWK